MFGECLLDELVFYDYERTFDAVQELSFYYGDSKDNFKIDKQIQ